MRYFQDLKKPLSSINQPDKIEEQLINSTKGRDIELIVVTDGEGILGIGDWGVNGVDIAIGKLMVYTAAVVLILAKCCQFH